MDPTCVYDHTPDLVKRSRLLRALLAYDDEPLTIVAAGDAACRLKLPATHHAYVLSGDAGAASCAANGAACVGAIPVVDATYATDGGESAKGCDDPARFWRDGGGGFDRGAPFVFVKDWDNLAEAAPRASARPTTPF
ncbi:hypothetical protein SO694_00029116 [Aureococcus anophagefferens]|uniref:Uncharacterized protein n=1 Tax=Aureococcus anophagefferens TaxID=44056 RepID=A0ABR1FVQ6_AURAN